MRIEFDASNDTELTAVFVMLAVLRGGDLSLPLLGDDDSGPPLGGDVRIEPAVTPMVPVAPPAAPIAAELPTPAPAPAVPPAPPVATAPPAPSPAPTGVEVDASGLPWDKRIHSTPPSKKKDGHWRGKRGLDDATREAVTAELKQAMAAPAPAAPPVPAPMFEEAAPGVPLPPTAPDLGVSAHTAFGAESAGAVSSVPPPPPAVAPPPAAPVPAPPAVPAAPAAPDLSAPATDFAGLMRKITSLQSAGQLTVQGTTEIAASLGITGVRDLMHRPDLIPSFDALLPTGV